MKCEIPQMLRQGGGTMVNTASATGLVGTRGTSAYVASKHGVVGLTKTAVLEYAQQGIRVNCVCPGVIHTPMTERGLSDSERRVRIIASEPMGRVGTPEESAEAVVWLCSEAALFVTGHTMTVDGAIWHNRQNQQDWALARGFCGIFMPAEEGGTLNCAPSADAVVGNTLSQLQPPLTLADVLVKTSLW